MTNLAEQRGIPSQSYDCIHRNSVRRNQGLGNESRTEVKHCLSSKYLSQLLVNGIHQPKSLQERVVPVPNWVESTKESSAQERHASAKHG